MDHLERARELLRAGDAIGAVAAARAAGRRPEADLVAGIACTVAGLWTDAETHLVRALAGELGERKALGLYHLGLTYEHTNRPGVAAGVFAAAAAEWGAAGRPVEAARADLNACWLLANTGNITEAIDRLEDASEQPEVEAVRKALGAYLAVQAGDLATTADLAAEVVESHGEPWPRCLATYAAGVAAAHLGQSDRAQELCREGAALLPAAGDSRLTTLYVELRASLAVPA